MTFLADPDSALEWLTGLYAFSPEDEWVNIFMDDSRGHVDSEWAPVSQLSDLRQHVAGFTQRGDVYFSVATRRQRMPGKERGKEADCLHLPGFWCDVDIDDGTGAHKVANLPGSIQAGVDLIQRFPAPPSAVVRSGHGLQPWWLLQEPLPVSEARPLLKRWQLTWEAIAAEQGLHIDDVSDPTRMMRLPGTLNRKSAPVPATFKANWLRRWPLSHLEDQLVDLPAASEAPKQRVRAFTGHLAGHAFNKAVPPGDVLARAGCEQISHDAEGSHWHWPGASHDKSFTVWPRQPDEDWPHATCWSESCAARTGIPVREPLSSFALLAWFFHGGDFSRARRWLISEGWTDTAGQPPEAPRRPPGDLKVVFMDKVPLKKVQWLWKPWLPRAKLVILDGDPSVGKSTVVVDLAARISKGWLMPDGSQVEQGGTVILAAAEDDAEDTVKPRLMAADANLERIGYVKDDFTLPTDLQRLEDVVAQTGAVLVIIDVLYEYLDAATDSYRDQSVRAALRQVRAMAERTGAAVLMLRHFTKALTGKAIHRGGGSIGLTGAARAVWMVGYHPEDESLHVLAPIKLNIAAMPQPLGFRLVSHDTLECAYVHWQGPVSISTDQLLNPPVATGEAGEEVTHARALDEAVRTALGDGEWTASNDLYQLFQPHGFTRKQIWLATDRVGVERRQISQDTPEGVVRLWQVRLGDQVK